MRILVFGFGKLARDLVSQIKLFPEYGYSNDVFIYHIFVSRNSLSYGKDLVVEIPDPHGDGYRTYKDGFEALPEYATTVSNYKPWLLEEAASGSFDTIIDCTTPGLGSAADISDIVSASSKKISIIYANDIGLEVTISSLRLALAGKSDWSPRIFAEDFWIKASELSKHAEDRMKKQHLLNRISDISSRASDANSTNLNSYSVFDAIPDFDKPLIDRFVVLAGQGQYRRVETYNKEHDCIIIEHDLLINFFGWHHTEQLAAREFRVPGLRIESAKYVKYLSDNSTPLDVPDSDYVIEYVHSGTLDVTCTDGSIHIPLESGTMKSSYAYRPKINPPMRRSIHAGLEVITFTYRENYYDN